METMTGFLFLKDFLKMSRSVYFGIEIDVVSLVCMKAWHLHLSRRHPWGSLDLLVVCSLVCRSPLHGDAGK